MDTELHVTGMTCENCVRHVKTALESVSGVTTAHVDLEQGKATVFGVAPKPALQAAVRDAGYDVTTD